MSSFAMQLLKVYPVTIVYALTRALSAIDCDAGNV